MANNRLYIVDTETLEYICIAKTYDSLWMPGNLGIYSRFIKSRFSKDNLLIGNENDDDFYDKWIAKGTNFNKSNKWNYTYK